MSRAKRFSRRMRKAKLNTFLSVYIRRGKLNNGCFLTSHPSEFFRTIDRVGTIEKGKRADLILLDANPLENISNTERRSGVMLKGKFYTQAEMNRWLDEIAPKISGSLIEKKPDDEKSAAAVADKLFEAMRAKNADAIRALFIAEGQLTAIDKPRDGSQGLSKTRNFSADAFAKNIAGGAGEYIEKMPDKEVKIYGDAAVVFGRYTFHVGEKFSHCGANAFHLLRTETGWKIANATSTLEFTNCDAKETKATENKDALAAVDKLFDLMTAHKPKEIIQLHTPESQLVALIKEKDGKNKTEVLSREAFSKFFAVKRGEITEKMHNAETKVFGDIALVFGRYVFTVNGKLAHCGMNSFHLIRTEAGWRIGNSTSTIEPDGCTEKEKTMVKK